MSNDLREYLEQEVAASERSFKIGVILLAVTAVILIAYFTWLKNRVAEMTKPDNVAELMLSEVRRNLPTAADALKKNLASSAPEITGMVVDTVVDRTVPMMRITAEKLFNQYSIELATIGVDGAQKVFEQIVIENKDKLKERADTAAGMYTSDNLMADLTRQINEEMGQRLNSLPQETLGFKLDQSVVALRNINHRLKELASSKNLDRKDQLGRQLISTWWTLLQQAETENTTATEKMLEDRPKMKTREDFEEE